MKLSEAMRFLTPSSLDAIKQAYRQGYEWRDQVVHYEDQVVHYED